ncbi:MAG: hypothetical protein AAGA18_06780 [Verrucomicrobiota bacterium]
MKFNTLPTLTLFSLLLTSASSLNAQDSDKAEKTEEIKEFNVGAFQFDIPEDWNWIETSSPMRAAQLSFINEDLKKKVDVVFFHFGRGQGGQVHANLERWKSQFNPLDESEIYNAIREGNVIHYLSAKGTYNRGIPGGKVTPVKDSGLLGAIIEHPRGSVFAKMTGPYAVVKTATLAFRTMIEGQVPSDPSEEDEKAKDPEKSKKDSKDKKDDKSKSSKKEEPSEDKSP